MARIYQAEHSGLRRQVALKVLLDASTRAPEGRERFLREARIAAAIKHPNVVNIFDVGVYEDTAFLVMELLTGTDLEQLIEERGALDEGTIIDIMVPVLAGLTAVHDAGVVHRDLKPGNVFLAQGRYDELDPKLLDFGISKAAGPEQLRLTANGMLIGTPFYMSPEGLRGEEMTPASDQYSLGVVMYECATGTNPFHASTFAEIFKLIGAGQYPAPSSTQPQISKRLERIIMRAMSLDPAQRYKDLREMGRDLLVLAGQRTRITWSLSFGEIDRPRTASWTVPERPPPRPLDDDELALLRPKRHLLMPLLWTALGAAIVFFGLAWAGIFSRQAQPESKLPASAAAAPAGNARAGSSEPAPANQALANQAVTAKQAVAANQAAPAAPAIIAPRAPEAVADTPVRPVRRGVWPPPRHNTGAAQAATKTDENNPDWALASPTPSPTRPAGQTRTQVGVGANGAPIFD
jgi:serine/threonine-protein kinase